MPTLSDDDVRWLLKALEEEDLDEIEVVQGDERVLVRARHPMPATVAPVGAAQQLAAPPQTGPAPPAGIPVTSPMAGIFYAAPSPDADPFVEAGDRIEAGQVIGLIEAMKLFNEVPSHVSGVITKIVVRNEQRVEPDQVLMYVQPVLSQQ